jgi:hypothetical protein
MNIRIFAEYTNRVEPASEVWEYMPITTSIKQIKKNPYHIWKFLLKTEYQSWSVGIVTCVPIAKQRLGKHIPAQANSLNNRTLLLGNVSVNTPP